MAATAELKKFVAPQPMQVDKAPDFGNCAAVLRRAFGTSFTWWDADCGELLYASLQQPGSNDQFRGQLVRAIYGTEAQFIADEDCVLLLAIPMEVAPGRRMVATAVFVVRPVQANEHLSG